MGVGGEIPGDSNALERLSKGDKMSVGRGRDVNVGQSQPLLEPVKYVVDRKRPLQYPGVSGNSQESQQDDPGQPNSFGAGQASIPPMAGCAVHRRV